MGWNRSEGAAESYPRGSPPPGWWLCLPLPPPRGFLQEAVSLAEVSLIVQPVQEGFLEETQANW